MSDAAAPAAWRGVIRHVAFQALMRSVAINMIAPSVLYRVTAPHFAPTSLMPLAISGLPPIIALLYGLIRFRAVDFLGFFAVENLICTLGSLLLAHGEQGALVGRALQNIPLALIYLGSLALGRPMVLFMARQVATGNDPACAGMFDRAATQPSNLKVYRAMTWVWAAAFTVKSLGSVYLALTFATRDFLIVSPLWDLLSDAALVTWSMLYGRAHLGEENGGRVRPYPLPAGASS